MEEWQAQFSTLRRIEQCRDSILWQMHSNTKQQRVTQSMLWAKVPMVLVQV